MTLHTNHTFESNVGGVFCLRPAGQSRKVLRCRLSQDQDVELGIIPAKSVSDVRCISCDKDYNRYSYVIDGCIFVREGAEEIDSIAVSEDEWISEAMISPNGQTVVWNLEVATSPAEICYKEVGRPVDEIATIFTDYERIGGLHWVSDRVFIYLAENYEEVINEPISLTEIWNRTRDNQPVAFDVAANDFTEWPPPERRVSIQRASIPPVELVNHLQKSAPPCRALPDWNRIYTGTALRFPLVKNWEFRFGRHDNNSGMIVGGGGITFVCNGRTKITALDVASGDQIWEVDLVDDLEKKLGFRPVSADKFDDFEWNPVTKQVYVRYSIGTFPNIAVIDSESPEVKWRRGSVDPPSGMPSVLRYFVLLPEEDEFISCRDTERDRIIWRIPRIRRDRALLHSIRGQWLVEMPATATHLVCKVFEDGIWSNSVKRMCGINLISGNIDWETVLPTAFQHQRERDGVTFLYNPLNCPESDRILIAVDSSSGAIKWQHKFEPRVSMGVRISPNLIWATKTLENGVVYTISYCRHTGEKIGEFEDKRLIQFAGDYCLLSDRRRKSVTLVNETCGAPSWSETFSQPYESTFLTEDALFIRHRDESMLCAIQLKTGKLMWERVRGELGKGWSAGTPVAVLEHYLVCRQYKETNSRRIRMALISRNHGKLETVLVNKAANIRGVVDDTLFLITGPCTLSAYRSTGRG